MRLEKNECIVLRDDEGYIIDVWRSCSEAGKALKVTGQTVCNILDGKVRRSVKVKGHLSIESLLVEKNEAA